MSAWRPVKVSTAEGFRPSCPKNRGHASLRRAGTVRSGPAWRRSDSTHHSIPLTAGPAADVERYRRAGLFYRPVLPAGRRWKRAVGVLLPLVLDDVRLEFGIEHNVPAFYPAKSLPRAKELSGVHRHETLRLSNCARLTT